MVGSLAGCGSGGGSSGNGMKVFALSGRGRRVSQAALAHNANKRFLNADAVVHAHPGDTSQVITLIIPRSQWEKLFAHGAVGDLRNI